MGKVNSVLKKIKTFGVLFLLSAFLFVQLPFAAFHDHHTHQVCKTKFDNNQAHFHEDSSHPCFSCKGSLLKDIALACEDQVFVLPVYFNSFTAFNCHKPSIYFHSDNGRAPPVSFFI